MAVIDLTGLRFREAPDIMLQRFGVTTTPPQGGEEEEINRLGDRWAMRLATIPYDYEPWGRVYAARLGRARKAGGLFSVRVPGGQAIDFGSPTVASTTASGKSLPITGGWPNRTVREGQWVSVVVSGQRYLDRIAADVTLNGSGAGTLTLENLIRVPMASGSVVELTAPKIEGRVECPESWPSSRSMQFDFTVYETR